MSNSNLSGRLTVHSSGARIEVFDAYLRSVTGGGTSDYLDMRLPSGAYSVTALIGGTRATQGVLVRPGGNHRVELDVLTRLVGDAAGG